MTVLSAIFPSWYLLIYSFRLTVPVFCAQHLLVDLADACLVERFDKHDPVRNGKTRDHALVGIGFNVLLHGRIVHVATGTDDKDGERALAPFSIPHADDRGLAQAWHLEQDVLQLDR